jgi:hypothetical protein
MRKNNVKQRSISIKKGYLCAIAILLGTFLSACQLAQEYNEWERFQEDLFIGFFVTFDEIGTTNPSLNKAFGTNDRVYAEREDHTRFTFPGVEGIPFFTATVYFEYDDSHERGSSYVSFSDVGPGIVSDTNHVHITDGETRRTLLGTLYVNPRISHMVYVFNPIFQTPGGDIYIGRDRSSVSVARDGWVDEGRIQAFRKEQTITVTENGISRTDITTVELAISIKLPPERIVILQMDAASRIITSNEYKPGDVPDEISPHPETAFIIVETHRHTQGENPVIRDLYNKTDGNIETFYEMENGVINQRFTRVVWGSG